ncbi:hypothetical protein OROHE_027216 [Orobanche hederae]
MGRSSDNQSVLNRILLRFRPIAPKPFGGKSASGAVEHESGNVAWRRAKRKYVRVRGRQGKHCARTKVTEGEKTSSSPPEMERSAVLNESSPEKITVTLQLLPERSVTEHNSCDISTQRILQENLTDHNTDRCNLDAGVSPEVTADNSVGGSVDFRTVGSVIETMIAVECVTDWFADQVGLGFSDKEMVYSLEKDTCPGFLSDGTNNVIWVNEAYKKMVTADDGEITAAEKRFLVWLVVNDDIPHFYPSFACRARIVQQRGKGQKWNKIMPCDVWRMDFGGLAWKLDVNTALSLNL